MLGIRMIDRIENKNLEIYALWGKTFMKLLARMFLDWIGLKQAGEKNV